MPRKRKEEVTIEPGPGTDQTTGTGNAGLGDAAPSAVSREYALTGAGFDTRECARQFSVQFEEPGKFPYSSARR